MSSGDLFKSIFISSRKFCKILSSYYGIRLYIKANKTSYQWISLEFCRKKQKNIAISWTRIEVSSKRSCEKVWEMPTKQTYLMTFWYFYDGTTMDNYFTWNNSSNKCQRTQARPPSCKKRNGFNTVTRFFRAILIDT